MSVRAWSASVLVAALVVLCALAPSTAAAQSDASLSGAARELFASGVEAARAERLDEAIAAFERSYALSPRDATLLNLAQVQERAGRVVAALDSYRRFLARADAELLERHGQRARDAVASLAPRVARLEVMVFGLQRGDVIELDGSPLARESLGLDLLVDPGAHVVTVTRAGASCGSRELTLADGGRAGVEVRVLCAAALMADPATTTSSPPPSDPTPWIALGVGGGVVIVGAVILGVLLAAPGPAGPEPFVGNVGAGAFVVP